MVVCHQPYSEIKKIPVSQMVRLTKTFEKWIGNFFNSDNGKSGKNSFIPNLPPPPGAK